MERYGKEITVKEVVKKARCSNCGQKNNFEFRIIYIGGSYDFDQALEALADLKARKSIGKLVVRGPV